LLHKKQGGGVYNPLGVWINPWARQHEYLIIIVVVVVGFVSTYINDHQILFKVLGSVKNFSE